LETFEPIAIIGQGCVLPGCFTPEELWQMVSNNEVNITTANSDDWRIDINDVIASEDETS
jgi:acyl transferase domain-containing protein